MESVKDGNYELPKDLIDRLVSTRKYFHNKISYVSMRETLVNL